MLPNAALPVTTVVASLKKALQRHATVILQAPPGAGKTTGIPLMLLAEPWLADQRIIMLQPRRLAARAAAQRMADQLGERPGETVGYRMRMDTRVGPATRIEVVTEGVLTRMVQSDPALTGVGLVILDEFHERSLETDLALALCRDMQGILNEDLRLLIMSATLDTDSLATRMGDIPVLTCEGRSFPVETIYRPRLPNQSVEDAVVATVVEAANKEQSSILVFLPGAAEIRRVARRLETALPGPQWHIAPLFGNLPRDRQTRAIAPTPAGRSKIVLATAIAETSLTIDGIRTVVDSGLSRVPRFDAGSGMTRLVTLPVTRASADQRRGRAGRTAPGKCFRLWTREQHNGLVPHARPGILEADLAPLAMELALWGLKNADTLNWIDPPPPVALGQGRDLLSDLGALGLDGQITDHGRRMADIPLHHRLAHMVLMAMDTGDGALACDLAALLSERDIMRTGSGRYDADVGTRLELMDALRRSGQGPASAGILDIGACRRVLKVTRDLRRRLGCRNDAVNSRLSGRLLAWAYPDRIAQRRHGGRGRFRLSGGQGAFLDPTEPLAAQDYLVAANLDGERREARIYLGAAIDIADLKVQFEHKLQWVTRVDWDAAREAVRAQRQLTLGKLCLKTEPLTAVDPQARTNALLQGIRSAGLDGLPWTQRLRSWQARVLFLRRVMADGDQWPDVSDAALLQTLETWLGPFVDGYSRLKDLGPSDLAGALRAHLSWSQHQRLDALAPTHLVVPSGSRRTIDYRGEIPLLAVRIQEMFGTRATPAIAEGRQPLLLHLLSPAGRPAQITRDLAGFWQNSYAEVKKELQGRYPKHYWPDDPLTAVPTARVRPV